MIKINVFPHRLRLCMCKVFKPDLVFSVGCSTETLLQEIKSVVAEKNQLQGCINKAANLGKFWILTPGKNHRFCLKELLYGGKASDRDFNETTDAPNYEKKSCNVTKSFC